MNSTEEERAMHLKMLWDKLSPEHQAVLADNYTISAYYLRRLAKDAKIPPHSTFRWDVEYCTKICSLIPVPLLEIEYFSQISLPRSERTLTDDYMTALEAAMIDHILSLTPDSD